MPSEEQFWSGNSSCLSGSLLGNLVRAFFLLERRVEFRFGWKTEPFQQTRHEAGLRLLPAGFIDLFPADMEAPAGDHVVPARLFTVVKNTPQDLGRVVRHPVTAQ